MNKKDILDEMIKILNTMPDDKIDGFVLAISGHEGYNAFTQISASIDDLKINTNAFILTKFVHVLLDNMNKFNEDEIFKLMESAKIPPEILVLYKKMAERTSENKNNQQPNCFLIGKREILNAINIQNIYIKHMEYNVSIIAKLINKEKRLFVITDDDALKNYCIAKDILNKISIAIKSNKTLDLKNLESMKITLMI
jgi:hypothetical protein